MVTRYILLCKKGVLARGLAKKRKINYFVARFRRTKHNLELQTCASAESWCTWYLELPVLVQKHDHFKKLPPLNNWILISDRFNYYWKTVLTNYYNRNWKSNVWVYYKINNIHVNILQFYVYIYLKQYSYLW